MEKQKQIHSTLSNADKIKLDILYTCDKLIYLKSKWILSFHLLLSCKKHLFPCHSISISNDQTDLECMIMEKVPKESLFIPHTILMDSELEKIQQKIQHHFEVFVDLLRCIENQTFFHSISHLNWKTIYFIELKRSLLHDFFTWSTTTTRESQPPILISSSLEKLLFTT